MSLEATYQDEARLELGLGLSIGGGRPTSEPAKPNTGRILTAKDFPCVSGTKRNADSVSRDGGGSSPPRASQVVGWPPIRASRMYQSKTQRSEDQENNTKSECEKENNHSKEASNKEQGNLGFVKVNVDGIAIGRKVDLKSHSCYDSLANTLQDLFFTPGMTVDLNGSSGVIKEPSKLLDGSSDFVLTYEDKDSDWMLVGDVPWRMFIGSVKRLRIMRTSEVTGLAPRFHQRNERQRIKPI